MAQSARQKKWRKAKLAHEKAYDVWDKACLRYKKAQEAIQKASDVLNAADKAFVLAEREYSLGKQYVRFLAGRKA